MSPFFRVVLQKFHIALSIGWKLNTDGTLKRSTRPLSSFKKKSKRYRIIKIVGTLVKK